MGIVVDFSMENDEEQHIGILLPKIPMSMKISGIKVDMSHLKSVIEKHRHNNMDPVELVTKLFPIVVNYYPFETTILPKPLISIKEFKKCGFTKELENIPEITMGYVPYIYEDIPYARIWIGTNEDDIRATYLGLFHLLMG